MEKSANIAWAEGPSIWGTSPAKSLRRERPPPDFACDSSLKGKLRYTHRRRDDGTDIYFVVNKIDGVVQGLCSFARAHGCPEFWRPQTGRIEPVGVFERWRCADTCMPLAAGTARIGVRRLSARPGKTADDSVVSVTRDGRNIFAAAPDSTKIVVKRASYGVLGDPGRTRDVTAKVQAIVDGGERRFEAWRLGEGDDPAPQTMKTLRSITLSTASPAMRLSWTARRSAWAR